MRIDRDKENNLIPWFGKEYRWRNMGVVYKRRDVLSSDSSLAAKDLGNRRRCHARHPGGFGLGHASFFEEVLQHVRA